MEGSVRENLLWCKPEATKQELYHVLQQADLEEWFQQLPQGFDSSICTIGHKISGGELQKFALARAFAY